jgi:PASTA domain/Low-density lipoprotein receptor repeat class B
MRFRPGSRSTASTCTGPRGGSINAYIGRANLDGTLPNQHFLTLQEGSGAIAVNGSFIYWTDYGRDLIARANLDGTNLNESLIPLAQGSRPDAIALNGPYVYWLAPYACAAAGCGVWSGAIGRANLDGTNPDQTLITNTPGSEYVAAGLAVDSAQANPTATSVSCKPAVLSVFHNDTGDEWTYTTCVATVADTATAQRAVRGSISFSVQGPGFNDADTNTCNLKPDAAAGTASCSISYQPSVFPPLGAGSATVSSAYSGETVHSPSTGTGTLELNLNGSGGMTGGGGGGGKGAGRGVSGCRVPRVVGKTLSAAKKAITKAHCKVGTVKRRLSAHRRRGHVISQSPKAGRNIARGKRIDLVVGR